MMSAPNDNLAKADVIKRVVSRCIATKTWRSECEKEATGWLERTEKARKSDVLAFVKTEYDAAGALPNGRW